MRFWPLRRLTNQLDKLVLGILTILDLRAESPRIDDQNAIFGKATSRQPH